MKKIMLGTSDIWLMSRLSQRPNNPATQHIILKIVGFIETTNGTVYNGETYQFSIQYIYHTSVAIVNSPYREPVNFTSVHFKMIKTAIKNCQLFTGVFKKSSLQHV